MSVYTEVTRDDLITFLESYALGELVSYEGISEGIENTNYFVTTTQGQYVLTLFEQYAFDELGYFLHVMAFFYKHGIPSAHPAADKSGEYLNTLAGKPAALVHRLAGRGVSTTATEAQCAAMGDVLADMHLSSSQFGLLRLNARGGQWRQSKGHELMPELDAPTAALLKEELAFQARYSELALPTGVVHADLFRDNALFEGDVLKGIIDFYYACDEYLLYDLAVAVNDWCVGEDGVPDEGRYQALMQAYLSKRQLSEAEQTNWNLVLRAGALRFWLSRLQDKLFPREGELTQIKNPDAFLKILQFHRTHFLGFDFA